MFKPGDLIEDLARPVPLGIGIILWCDSKNGMHYIRFLDYNYHDSFPSKTIEEARSLLGTPPYYKGGPDTHSRLTGDIALVERQVVSSAKWHRLARFELILEE